MCQKKTVTKNVTRDATVNVRFRAGPQPRRCQCSLPVFPARRQPRPCAPSIQHSLPDSTAILCSQPQSSAASVPSRTSTAILRRHARNTVKKNVRRDGRNICQNVRKNVRRNVKRYAKKNVRQNVRKNVRRNVNFFCSMLLRCDLSCEEGPGQSALQSAYHDPQLDKLNWNQQNV